MKDLFLRKNILLWYEDNKRDLPWRNNRSPYQIWISEIILQQTRIEQGTEYYLQFIERLPTVKALASASEQEVLNLWQGLGYYSRARNLLAGARQVMNSFKGKLPETAKELKEIKGIGEYTAAAIASIAFGEAIAAIDGNVYRVLSRYYGLKTAIDSTAGKKAFKTLANKVIDKNRAGDFNQAMMDFGALQCKHLKPACEQCPLKPNCFAHNENMIAQLPFKEKKQKVRARYLNYFILDDGENIIFRKRTGNDIWRGLYDFPLVESTKSVSLEKLVTLNKFRQLFPDADITIGKVSKTYQHQLSHQKLHIKFVHLTQWKANISNPDFVITGKKNIFELPVPRVIEKYIDEDMNFE